MSNIVTVRVQGLSELQKAFESKPRNIAKKLLRRCLRKAANVIRIEMIARVRRGWHHYPKRKGKPAAFGVLSRSISMRVSMRGDEIEGKVSIGPLRSGFWSGFLEFGTRKIAAIPFMRPAFDLKKQEALNVFVAEGKRILEEETK